MFHRFFPLPSLIFFPPDFRFAFVEWAVRADKHREREISDLICSLPRRRRRISRPFPYMKWSSEKLSVLFVHSFYFHLFGRATVRR